MKMQPETFNKLPGVASIRFEPVMKSYRVANPDIPFSYLGGYGGTTMTVASGYVNIEITSDEGETRRWTYPTEKARRFFDRVCEMAGKPG